MSQSRTSCNAQCDLCHRLTEFDESCTCNEQPGQLDNLDSRYKWMQQQLDKISKKKSGCFHHLFFFILPCLLFASPFSLQDIPVSLLREIHQLFTAHYPCRGAGEDCCWWGWWWVHRGCWGWGLPLVFWKKNQTHLPQRSCEASASMFAMCPGCWRRSPTSPKVFWRNGRNWKSEWWETYASSWRSESHAFCCRFYGTNCMLNMWIKHSMKQE